MSDKIKAYAELLKKYQKLLKLWYEIYGEPGVQAADADAPGSNPIPPPPPPPPHS